MDLLLNDLSLHGQFPDAHAFQEAIGRIMEMNAIARRFRRRLYTRRDIIKRRVHAALLLREATQQLTGSQRTAFLSWVTKAGPFWEDYPRHDSDHLMQCGDEIVTDTAIGETAYRRGFDIDARLVSFDPSDWTYSPVTIQMDPEDVIGVTVPNYWIPAELEDALENTPAPVASWDDLEMDVRTRLQRLTFSAECFDDLAGRPFVLSAADSIRIRLGVLNQLLGLIDESGRRTSEWNQLHQKHFRGTRAWFSDASAREKNQFRNEMTFPHPERSGEYLFCSLHGKVNRPPYRIHFAWPGSPGPPLYVTYVGWKRTV